LTGWCRATPWPIRPSASADARWPHRVRGGRSGKLIDVLIAAYGLQVAQGMIAVEAAPEASIVVSGYVSAPSLSRANRHDLTLFVNGRWVQDRNLAFAVVQAYHSMLMVGRYPLCFLRVELPPEEVDVNVHPAKSEVRFRNPDQVFRAVQRAVRASSSNAPLCQAYRSQHRKPHRRDCLAYSRRRQSP